MRTPPDIFVPPIPRTLIGLLVAIGMLSVGPGPVAAQRSTSHKSTATKKSSAAKPARTPAAPRAIAPVPGEAKPALEDSGDSTLSSFTLRPFLTGDEWQDTLLRFEQWLSVQTLYDAEQVRQMRARFAERAKRTSTADRKHFINEVDAKLQILYSPGIYELEAYFEETLAAATPAYAKKRRQQLPDVVGLTPEQLKERLARFALRHQSTAEVHQTFEQMRQLQIVAHEARENSRRIEQARPPAGHFASSSAGANRQSTNGFTQARDYFPPSGHSISYSIIPAMPMMTGGGWAMFGGGVAITIQRNR